MADQLDETMKQKFKATGISLVSLGSLSTVLGIITIALWVTWVSNNPGFVVTLNEPGIYVGIWAIVTGSLAITTSKNSSQCSIISGRICGGFLIAGSLYMLYFEGYNITVANTLDQTAQAVTHGLTLVCGLGFFIADIVLFVFSYQAQRMLA